MLDLNNFAPSWRYHAPVVNGQQLEVLSDPIVLDGVVYVILSDASLRAIDFTTGLELGLWQGKAVVDKRFTLSVLIPSLAVGDGRLFASFGTKELCAFGKQP